VGGGANDTGSDEAVSFIVANFFAATRWPINGDKIDIKLFVSTIREYAEFMGYKIDTMPE